MTNITESAQWDEGIYQIKREDRVSAGRDGVANKQAEQLANRTLFLKLMIESVADSREYTFKTTESDPDGTISGLLGTPEGRVFRVALGADKGFKYYLNDSNIAFAIAEIPGVEEIKGLESSVNKISGDNPTVVPQIFESIDPDIPEAMVVTSDGKILAELPDPRVKALEKTSISGDFYETLDIESNDEFLVLDNTNKIIGRLVSSSIIKDISVIADRTSELQSTSVNSGIYETLDATDNIMIFDADGKVIGKITSTDEIQAEINSASGSQQDLTTRLNNGLTPFGDVKGPFASRWSVREVRMRLEKLTEGDQTQLTIGLLGDSYSNDKSYYSMRLAKGLQDKYGMAGVGWVGFGWYGAASGTWTETKQPVGISGSVRTDLSAICQVIGSWVCSYGQPSTNTPALYKITSSTIGDYVRFSVPPAGSIYNNSCRLFYSGDGTGVVQVSWDDGVTWGNNINLATVGAGNINLAGTPAAGCIARIKVVSGTVGIAGVDLQNTAPGVRIHKLGCSGSTAAQWAGVGEQWLQQMVSLSCKCHQVLLGTNDQGVSTHPSVFVDNITRIFSNLDEVLPFSDKVLVIPAENQRTSNVYKMPLYAAAARELAMTSDIGFCDLQTFFGSPDNYAFSYAYANPARRWYASDLIHPDGLTGGRAIASALNIFYTQF